MTIRTQWAGRAGTGKQGWRAGLALAAASAVSALLVMASATPASAAPVAVVFDAHAHGGKVTSVLINVPPLAPSDLSCTATPGSVTNNLAAASLLVATVTAIQTSASGTVDGTTSLRTAKAETKTGVVNVLGSLVTASAITATATSTEINDAGDVTSTGSAQLVDLRVNGTPIVNAGVNTTIVIPLIGTVHINEQVVTPDGRGITVNAVRVTLGIIGGDIVIGHARTSLTLPPATPTSCPIN